MKKLLFAILATGFLFSCSRGDEPTLSEEDFCSEEINLLEEQFPYPQAWKLVKMSGSMVNSETTGFNMAWQEYILLNEDGTFRKTRTEDNKTKDALGSYTFEQSLGGDPATIGLILSYNSDSDLIGSCQSNLLQETYILKSKCKLVGTWSACDGPGLEYTRQIVIVD